MKDRRPRVLLLVTLSEWGGAQSVVYTLATRLQADFEITVACAPGGILIKRLNRLGIEVIEIPSLQRNPHPWHDLRALWEIWRLIKRRRFDIVHTHSTKAGILGRLAAYLARVPVIMFTAHGWAFTEGRAACLRWFLAQTERFAAKMSTKIICVSECDRDLALKFKVARPEQLVVIHNGLDPRPFHGAQADRAWGSADAIITMVGRLAPPKDPLTLLRACQELSHIRVLLVGDGPLTNQVERFIQRNKLAEKVILTGFREDVPAILAASDVFVLSSRWEGLPLTIIEAMLAGLPVVATRVGGVPELVEDGVTGFLVSPGDSKAMAEALQKLLERKELRQRMGEAGREKALREFTLERMLREVRELYRVASGKPLQ